VGISHKLDNMEDLIKDVNQISYLSNLKQLFFNNEQDFKKYIEQYEKDPSDDNYDKLTTNVLLPMRNVEIN
jgi:hypothetical protein